MRPTGSVVHEEQRPEEALPGSNAWVRVMIDSSIGARHFVQRVFRFEQGRTPDLSNEISEDVMYVVSGLGSAEIGSGSIELAPGTAFYVPAEVDYAIENDGPHDLVMVSVLSPPPGTRPGPDAPPDTTGHRRFWVREEDQETFEAGPSRTFRILVDPSIGCRAVTQFVGAIDNVPAPPHRHTYEEAIYILGGEGTVEIDDDVLPIGRGTSIFLPPGLPHRLANSGAETLRLLGVFAPAGSPASKDDLPA
ncbi:MAG TPA: cupin domain-containing protein [Actinomycetota bacterium]